MKYFSKPNCNALIAKQLGFSTLDVLVAFFILVIGISGLAMLTSGNQNTSISTGLSNTGVTKAQQLLEGQRALAYQNFDSVVSASPASTDPSYLQQVDVTSPDQCHKVVTATVSWAEPSKGLQNASMTTLFSNVNELGATGGMCGGSGSGGPQLTYNCSNNACQAVLGSGGTYGSATSCQAACAQATHLDCVNNSCSMVNGSGPNTCASQGASCTGGTGATHLDCVNNSCSLVNGSGSNNCSTAGAICGGGSGGTPVNNCPANLNVTAGKFLPGSSFTSTGYASGVAVVGNLAYISFANTSAGDPDLFVVDVSNSQNPQVVSSVNTGSGTGLNALTAVSQDGRNYVFAAGNNINGQVVVIDVTDSAHPVVQATYKLTDFSGSGTPAISIFYRAKKVYVGTIFTASTDPEFHIVDVGNPLSPNLLGSYKVSAGVANYGQAGVNGIFVRQDPSTNKTLAYITTPDTAAELVTLDVSNPASITVLSQFDIGAAHGAQTLYYLNNNLYVGGSPGQVGGTVSPGQFYVLDVSNPALPVALGSKFIGGVPFGISASGILAFTGSQKFNFGKEFQVWDVSNPASIKLCSSTDFFVSVTGMASANGLLYTSLKSNVDPLRIIKLY